MNIKIGAHFDGIYDFTLYDKEGIIKQHVVSHNTICTNLLQKSILTFYAGEINTLAFGSGTTEPTFADTALATPLWDLSLSKPTMNIVDLSTSELVYTGITVPASASYVGEIAEVGFKYKYDSANYLYTHSLLKDAEGNLITINKTIDDTLVVNITLRCTISLPSYAQFLQRGYILPSTFIYGDNASKLCTLSSWILYYASSLRERKGFLRDLRVSFLREPLLGTNGTYTAISPKFVTGVLQGTPVNAMNFNGNVRLTADEGNIGYYRYMQIMVGMNTYFNGWGTDSTINPTNILVDMKDPTFFTPYTLEGMAVGTGDGVTTEFACPLNYFTLNTDVIYKNGVALTRGTDYTIDNCPNQSCLPELMPYTDDTVITGEIDGSRTAGTISQFSMEKAATINNLDLTKRCFAFSSAHPLLIDWGAAKACNKLRGYLNYTRTGTLTIAYSTDGENFIDVGSTSISTTGTAYKDITLTWDEITARYWRISVTAYNSSYEATNYAYFAGTGTYAIAFLGHSVANGITFTTAPAVGDILTMDADTDIPFKNDKHAFSTTFNLTLTFS